MNITYTDEKYSLDRVSTEHLGFLKGEGIYSAVYEQRDRKGIMIRTWQEWVEHPHDIEYFLKDIEDAIFEAVANIGRYDFMVRV